MVDLWITTTTISIVNRTPTNPQWCSVDHLDGENESITTDAI